MESSARTAWDLRPEDFEDEIMEVYRKRYAHLPLLDPYLSIYAAWCEIWRWEFFLAQRIPMIEDVLPADILARYLPDGSLEVVEQ